MELQTKVPLDKAGDGISYDSRIFLMGSCFAEHIGAKLEYYQFQNYGNPLGIFFHPKAIETFLERMVEGKQFQADEVFEHDQQWHSFEAHSRLSRGSREKLLTELNNSLTQAREFLGSATHVFLTLGTAWAYKHKRSDQWVANCHKVPQKQFTKVLWEAGELEACIGKILDMVRLINPSAQVVFTVSPVRHLKDGFLENQRSKAHLITAVHRLVQSGRAAYFPAYELMMDELRDYRFYKADLVHPNALAIDYIWEKFRKAWMTVASERVMEEVAAVRKGLAHRPFNPESENHQKFLESLHGRINGLQSKYPHMDFKA